MELIDRAALLNKVPKCDMEMHVMDVKRLISRQPTVAAAAVVHARWYDQSSDGSLWACSECGWLDEFSGEKKPMFCAGCGATMDAPARAEGEAE